MPLIGCLSMLNGQSSYAVVDSILLKGNKLTARSIILRELDFAVGDTLEIGALSERIELNKKRLLSTGLFTIINTEVRQNDDDKDHLTVLFDFNENWYIYPSVIWEYADRSFNVWWKDHRFNFNRTNYGLRLDHINLSGHKDRLKLKFQSGYTKKYELEYSYPYFIGSWGLGGSLFYSTNKELGFETVENRTNFFKAEDERVVLSRLRAGLSLSNRSNAFTYHNVRLEYHDNSIDDVVAKELNPAYFLNEKDRIQFFYAEYDLQYDKRLYPFYPEGGYLLFFNIKKEGLGLYDDFSNLSVSGGFEKFFKLGNHFVYGGRFKGKVNLDRRQVGYGNNTGLGYGDEVRGYELYVVDGTDFVLGRTDLKLRLLDKIFNVSKHMPISQFDLLPLTIWARLSFDFGYVNEPTYKATNFIANEWQLGGGPGLDIFIYNSYRFGIEYNINRLGEHGLFLQGSFNF